MATYSSPAVVLVADDEPSMLSLIAQHVRTLGHVVHMAHDGAEAWSLVQKYCPNLVLLDVMMPAMSGWEVCRKIRENPEFDQTGVIMITGIGEKLNELTSPLFGADAYLDKPFELVDLDDAIKTVLATRKESDSEPPPARVPSQGSTNGTSKKKPAQGKKAPATTSSAKKASSAKKSSSSKTSSASQRSAPKRATASTSKRPVSAKR